MAGVDIRVRKGTAQVQARRNKDRVLLKAGEDRVFSIDKNRPVIVRVSDGGQVTGQSTTGIVLLFEFEEDDFTHEIKLKPPLKQAMRHGKWVIMAPSVG